LISTTSCGVVLLLVGGFLFFAHDFVLPFNLHF
jgi:hypothetical protein